MSMFGKAYLYIMLADYAQPKRVQPPPKPPTQRWRTAWSVRTLGNLWHTERVEVKANTKSEARALLKPYFSDGINPGRIPPGLHIERVA